MFLRLNFGLIDSPGQGLSNGTKLSKIQWEEGSVPGVTEKDGQSARDANYYMWIRTCTLDELMALENLGAVA